MRAYGHLPVMTQDDADIYLLKAEKFREFELSLKQIADEEAQKETKVSGSPQERLG